MTTIVTRVTCSLKVAFICISLLAKDVEYFLEILPIILYFFIWECLVQSHGLFLKLSLFSLLFLLICCICAVVFMTGKRLPLWIACLYLTDSLLCYVEDFQHHEIHLLIIGCISWVIRVYSESPYPYLSIDMSSLLFHLEVSVLLRFLIPWSSFFLFVCRVFPYQLAAK